MRAGLALIAAVLGFYAVSTSLADVVARASPSLAHRLAPGDGQITARFAQHELALRPISAPASEPARLARLALKEDATAVDALSVLGLQAQMRQESPEARGLFAYSLELSRREVRARIWAIEEAVQRGDIAAALHNYDIALRTSHEAVNISFPVLSSALAEPKIRASLINLMKTRPLWEDDFINFVSRNARNPRDTVLFFQEGKAKGAKLLIDDADRVSVVNALAKTGRYEEAWQYYASFRPRADRRSSRDPDFTGPASASAVFDWQLGEDAGIYATFQKGAEGGMLDFMVPPNSGGILLRQLQILPPGAYRLAGWTAGSEQRASTAPYWLLSCLDGRELGRVAVPASGEKGRRFAGRFVVPSGCPVQGLVLVARPSDDLQGVSGHIEFAQLRPADLVE